MPFFKNKKPVKDESKREVQRKLVLVSLLLVVIAFYFVAFGIKAVDILSFSSIRNCFCTVEV